MKRLIAICLVCMCMLLTTAVSQGMTAAVPQGMTISFDENGNGNVDGTTLVWGMGTPPQAGTYDQYNTLYYELPKTVVEGDLVLYEYAPNEYISDVLRFVNINGAEGRVYVYSNPSQEKEQPELADTRLPYDYLGLSAGMDEQGTEDGWNGVVYTPRYIPEMQLSLPGYMDGANVTYNFTSDVPEPATICLLGLGSLALLKKRRAGCN